jgi:transcriptional regulator with XRE-family HTH domain
MRKRNGLTQAVVAEDMGVSEPLVSMLENGRRVRVDTLLRYADAVGGELAVIRRRDGRLTA